LNALEKSLNALEKSLNALEKSLNLTLPDMYEPCSSGS
jgi:hypothetical protein